jgi:hypothetical protein
MAHSSVCTNQYAQKALDGADIVRDAILRQQSLGEWVLKQIARIRPAFCSVGIDDGAKGQS